MRSSFLSSALIAFLFASSSAFAAEKDRVAADNEKERFQKTAKVLDAAAQFAIKEINLGTNPHAKAKRAAMLEVKGQIELIQSEGLSLESDGEHEYQLKLVVEDENKKIHQMTAKVWLAVPNGQVDVDKIADLNFKLLAIDLHHRAY